MESEAPREYTQADDKGVKEVILRSKVGTYRTSSYGEVLNANQCLFPQQTTHLVQSRSGTLVVAASQRKVVAVDLTTNKVLYSGDFTFIYVLALSPCERFVQIFDKTDMSNGRTTLLSVPGFKRVQAFEENANTNFITKENYPLLKFTSDDNLMFRYIGKSIQMYDVSSGEAKLANTIDSGVIDFLLLSKVSKKQDFLLAAFYLDKKSQQGKFYLYSQASLDKPFYVKNIDKAEQIKVKFSPRSHDFLIELQTYFDHTGKSYYGQYGLYFFKSGERKLYRVKTYQGPIHDFNWDPEGNNFIVISGFMPAGVVMFNNKNEPVYEFGKLHKNVICWNPQGRFLALAGFGNLNGDVEIWDTQLNQKIGECKSSSASSIEWSPDGRKFVTAIVTPRLRVDNNFKIFAYTGTLLSKFDMSHTELYEVQWLKTDNPAYNDKRGVSPGRKLIDFSKKNEEKKFFRPRGDNFVSQMLQGAKTESRVLTKNQTFGAPTPQQPKLKPGQHPEDVVPKKKKKKKNKQQDI